MIVTKTLNICLTCLIILGLCSCASTASISDNKQVLDSNSNDVYVVEEIPTVKQVNIGYMDQIFDNNIYTVLFHKAGFELSEPIIQLNSGDKLTLRFDLLSSNVENFQYEIIHCNQDWSKSNLLQQDYMEGFFQNNINDFKFSFNTDQNYINYSVNLPNDNISIKMSGNYVLKVFKNNNPEEVVFTRRFIVFESLVSINEEVKRATNLDDRNYRQEIDFTINSNGNDFVNPFANLKPIIRQNNRWDNAIKDLKPVFVRGDDYVYDYNSGENVFDGGNEFRYFDISNLRQKTDRISAILSTDTNYNVMLVPEKKRTYSNYVSWIDFNGNYVVLNRLGQDPHVESDYVYVYFNFFFPEKLENGDVYLFGKISDWNYSDKYKMSYNPKSQSYQKRLLVKQGHYNYMYMFKENGKSSAKIEFFEGTHYETQNNYSIIVYYKDPALNYDRVIGFKSFTSQLD